MTIVHTEPSPFAGKLMGMYRGTVHTPLPVRVEDWYDRVHGKSWTDSDSPAVTDFMVRVEKLHLPVDDDVLYVKHEAQNRGFLVHLDELVELKPEGSR